MKRSSTKILIRQAREKGFLKHVDIDIVNKLSNDIPFKGNTIRVSCDVIIDYQNGSRDYNGQVEDSTPEIDVFELKVEYFDNEGNDLPHTVDMVYLEEFIKDNVL